MCTVRNSVVNLSRKCRKEGWRERENIRGLREEIPQQPDLHFSQHHTWVHLLSLSLFLSLGVVGTTKATCLYRPFPFREFWQKNKQGGTSHKNRQFFKQILFLSKAHNYMSLCKHAQNLASAFPQSHEVPEIVVSQSVAFLCTHPVEETEPSL